MLINVDQPADSQGTYPTNAEALYSCLPGFAASGISAITCLATGQWQALTLTCTRSKSIGNYLFFLHSF